LAELNPCFRFRLIASDRAVTFTGRGRTKLEGVVDFGGEGKGGDEGEGEGKGGVTLI